VPVFRYKATTNLQEENVESGTVVADNEEQAKKKLKSLRLDGIQLKKVGGLMGLVGRWTADIR